MGAVAKGRPRSVSAQPRGLGGEEILGLFATLIATYPIGRKANA
jgi:hypothetical protein